MRHGDRRRDGPARVKATHAEVGVRRSRRLRRVPVLDPGVRPREHHAADARHGAEHPHRPVHQYLPRDDHGGPADDAEDQDRLHHGSQVLGRGIHEQADRRGHGRGALQLLARRSRGAPGCPRSLPQGLRGEEGALRRPPRHQRSRDSHRHAQGPPAHRARSRPGHHRLRRRPRRVHRVGGLQDPRGDEDRLLLRQAVPERQARQPPALRRWIRRHRGCRDHRREEPQGQSHQLQETRRAQER